MDVREPERLEQLTPFREWPAGEVATVEPEQVEDEERHRSDVDESRRPPGIGDVHAFGQPGEAGSTAVGLVEGDHLAVEQQVPVRESLELGERDGDVVLVAAHQSSSRSR